MKQLCESYSRALPAQQTNRAGLMYTHYDKMFIKKNDEHQDKKKY